MQLRLVLQGLFAVRSSLPPSSSHTIVNSSRQSLQASRSTGFRDTVSNRKFSPSLLQMTSESDADSAATGQKQLLFGKFIISPSQIFYKSPSGLTTAIVNLRPIVRGHVLVIPTRVVKKLSQLTNEEYDDLWRSVRIIQNALEKHYDAGGFNVAVQDGRVAGQSVPHVHVHILPRVEGDFERNDEIYDNLEDWAPNESMSAEKKKNNVELAVPEDEDREDRTMETMEKESATYKTLLGTEANI